MQTGDQIVGRTTEGPMCSKAIEDAGSVVSWLARTSHNERFPAPLAFGSLREHGAERMERLTYRVVGSEQR